MNQDPRRDEELFEAALALPAAERPRYLERACGGDAGLLRRVEALLRVQEEAGGFLETPALAKISAVARGASQDSRPSESPGDRIGRYKLLQKIGEGGCGVVFMAEQEEPIRRRVAIKVIKLGMDTKEVIARFEAERQALALMDHPNIARVLDAGATDIGRPYFVMELVRGVKITDYCDQQNFATAERLKLFVQVCHAIQHAHQKGVIHRDIKPSNILVTLQDGEPVPKVIDFGIAKATQGRLTDQTLFTAFEQFIGTPAYMSPEQAQLSSQDVDTRSDIYSLGVLLYELLTGQTPFDAKSLLQAGLDEIRRVIREVEPAKPSTRLRTLEADALTSTAQHRATEPPRLLYLVRGDLDWIVMRCLEKSRARRYETASSLAQDLERHLHNEPVVARPPSTAYICRKFLRRHRFAVGAGVAVVVALLAGLAASTLQAVRATHAEKLADTRLQSELAIRREAEDQRQLAVGRLVAEQAARQETERQKTLAEQERDRAQRAEELAAARLQAELAARREAEQQTKLADQQRALAEQERSRAQDAEKAAQIEAARSAEAARLMQNMLKGAGPYVVLVSDAKLLHRILDHTAQGLLAEPEGAARSELRDALTAVYYDLGDYATSTALAGKWAGQDHPPLALALDQLGLSLMRHARLADAEAVLREAVAVDRLVSVAGSGRSESLTMLGDLIQVLKLTGKLDEAARLDGELQARREKISGSTDTKSPEPPK
ncbi:MAG TPA: protein kinase [Opitutaceae bacterium]|nr:protein kinase [Opitutaceae bacterium]